MGRQHTQAEDVDLIVRCCDLGQEEECRDLSSQESYFSKGVVVRLHFIMHVINDSNRRLLSMAIQSLISRNGTSRQSLKRVRSSFLLLLAFSNSRFFQWFLELSSSMEGKRRCWCSSRRLKSKWSGAQSWTTLRKNDGQKSMSFSFFLSLYSPTHSSLLDLRLKSPASLLLHATHLQITRCSHKFLLIVGSQIEATREIFSPSC